MALFWVTGQTDRVETAREWETEVERHFAFLAQHGFNLVETYRWGWGVWVIYGTSKLFVKIEKSYEFQRVEMSIGRLKEGRRPKAQVFTTREGQIDDVLFDNVLEARAPGMLSKYPSGTSEDVVRAQLDFLAEALQTVAPDFLQNDDLAISEAGDLIRRRLPAGPPSITIHVPEGTKADASLASKAAELGAMADVREYAAPVGGTERPEVSAADRLLQARLIAAFDAFERDARTAGSDVRLRCRPTEDGWWDLCVSRPSGYGASTLVRRDDLTGSLTVLLAGLGQDVVRDEPWPTCPEHPGLHRLDPIERDGHAIWACDRSDYAVPIGQLGRSH
jgi:hypothetical protein